MKRLKEFKKIMLLSSQVINQNKISLKDKTLSKDYREKKAIENIKINNALINAIFQELI
jgi:hypothetical protein